MLSPTEHPGWRTSLTAPFIARGLISRGSTHEADCLGFPWSAHSIAFIPSLRAAFSMRSSLARFDREPNIRRGPVGSGFSGYLPCGELPQRARGRAALSRPESPGDTRISECTRYRSDIGMEFAGGVGSPSNKVSAKAGQLHVAARLDVGTRRTTRRITGTGWVHPHVDAGQGEWTCHDESHGSATRS